MERESSRLMRIAIDVGERLFVVLLGIPFITAFLSVIRLHPNFILLTLSETLGVILILTRKPGEISVRALSVFVAFGGTALPLVVRPGGASLVPPLVSSAVMLVGLLLSLLSKIYLNRSFGLVAANRGVKVGGPYRIVRHPMYLGYIINQLGFLTASFSPTNLAIYLLAWTFQIARVREEEHVLQQDPSYRQFAGRVTSKLIPGVF
jgi:protein-S-isoprenylcysteine O-methyltransferase Ste14